MKQVINLMPESQVISLRFLSFKKTLIFISLFFSGLVFFNLYLMFCQENLKSKIELIQISIQNRDKVLSVLLNKKLQSDAYSNLSLDRAFAHDVIAALLNAATENIFFKDIKVINNRQLELFGTSDSPQEINEFLKRLKYEMVFKGKLFNVFSFEKGDKNESVWHFKISSERIESEK